MSTSQQVKDALRNAGAPITSAQIREQLEDAVDAKQLSTTLANLERDGHIVVNRDERPFTFTLNTNAPTSTKAATPRRASTKKPAKAKATRKTPKPRKAAKVAKVKRKYTRSNAAVPGANAAAATSAALTVPKDVVLRLCALALSPDGPNAQECRDIADLLKAAA